MDSWAKKSAEAGDFLGIRDYARQIGFDSPESFALYANLWDQGHLSAAQALSLLHGRGITNHGTGQPNLIESYAFILISNQVLATALSREGQRLSADPSQTTNQIQMMDQVLAQRGAFLTSGQQQDAEKLAVNLLRSNTSCCKGRW